ncbi:signal peptide protein [Paenibacillus algorifonticola]
MLDIGMIALVIGLAAAMIGLAAWSGKVVEEGREEA